MISQIKLIGAAVFLTALAALMIGAYAKGRIEAGKDGQIAALRRELDASNLQTAYYQQIIDRNNKALQSAGEASMRDAVTIASLRTQAETIQNEAPDTCGPDRAATNRLRDFFKSSAAAIARVPGSSNAR